MRGERNRPDMAVEASKKIWFDFSTDPASLIIRASFDRRIHYSVAFRWRLCIAFVDVQVAAFVGKPVELARKTGVGSHMARRRVGLYCGRIGHIWDPDVIHPR